MQRYFRSAKNRENAALFLFCAAVLARNFLLLIDGLGEPDAARLLNDAIIWSKVGYLDPELTDYRVRISPLYIYTLKRLVDLGVGYGSIVDLMNAASAVAGALTFIATFKLFRLFLPFGAALFGLVVVAFAPSAFLASIYGMPHAIGYFFFVSALAAFATLYLGPEHSRPGTASRGRRPWTRPLWWSGMASLCLAAAFKADILLGAGAFLGVLLYARRAAPLDLAGAGLWIAAAASTPLLLHGFLVPEPASQALAFASDWNDKYALGLGNLVSPENLLVTALFAGPVFLALSAVCTVEALRSRAGRGIGVLVLLWLVPVVLFWGLRPGNSARHLMPAVVPMALVLGWAATRVSTTAFKRAALALTVVAANYIGVPPMGNTVAPSTQVLNSTAALQRKIDRLMAEGREIETSTAADHLLIGTGTLPYMVFNALRNADTVSIEEDGIRIVPRGGAGFTLRQRHVNDPVVARKLAQDARGRNRRVWSSQFDLDALLRVR